MLNRRSILFVWRHQHRRAHGVCSSVDHCQQIFDLSSTRDAKEVWTRPRVQKREDEEENDFFSHSIETERSGWHSRDVCWWTMTSGRRLSLPRKITTRFWGIFDVLFRKRKTINYIDVSFVFLTSLQMSKHWQETSVYMNNIVSRLEKRFPVSCVSWEHMSVPCSADCCAKACSRSNESSWSAIPSRKKKVELACPISSHIDSYSYMLIIPSDTLEALWCNLSPMHPTNTWRWFIILSDDLDQQHKLASCLHLSLVVLFSFVTRKLFSGSSFPRWTLQASDKHLVFIGLKRCINNCRRRGTEAFFALFAPALRLVSFFLFSSLPSVLLSLSLTYIFFSSFQHYSLLSSFLRLIGHGCRKALTDQTKEEDPLRASDE